MLRSLRLVTMLAAAFISGCTPQTMHRASVQRSVYGPTPEVFRVVSSSLRSRGYSTYFGNPGLDVMASQEVDTFWSPGARILGVVLTPAFLITWPVVLLLPVGEGKAWWPMMGFAIANSADISRQIHVKFTMCANGALLVDATGWSHDPVAPRDIDWLMDELSRRYPARQVVDELLQLEPICEGHP